MNAVYFKSDWKYKFEDRATGKRPFNLSPKNQIQVDMMYLPGRSLPYAEIKELDAKVLSLPYADERLNLLIILPNANDGIAALETKLDAINLAQLQNKLAPIEIDVSLPKFKIEGNVQSLPAALTKVL